MIAAVYPRIQKLEDRIYILDDGGSDSQPRLTLENLQEYIDDLQECLFHAFKVRDELKEIKK